MNIQKKAALLAASLLALSACSQPVYAESQEWVALDSGDSMLSISLPQDNGFNYKATAQISKGEGGDLFRMFGEKRCNPEDTKMVINVWNVSGTPVSFTTGCTNNGYSVVFPTNPAGSSFIVKHFKTDNVVEVGGLKFSAKGFNNVYKSIKAPL